MSGFHDVRFPLALAAGARGGPGRRTEVLTLASGREVRGASWAGSRRRWDVGGAVDTLSKLHDVIAFFEARQGRLYAFRFRDPMDFSSAGPGADVSALDQVLGEGDDAQVRFGLRKAYGDVLRAIGFPLIETVRVAVDGVEVLNWTIEDGEIVFDAPPSAGAGVTAGFEFDCAVRFESDRLEGVVEAFDIGRAVKIGLVEVAI
ncbi:MAG: DUF2460 domain-containing protein [Pseudomonadota bacterium]